MLTIRKIILLVTIGVLLCQMLGCSSRLQPTQVEAKKISAFEAKYRKLANSNWPVIKYTQMIRPGKNALIIPEVRHRLSLLGDYQKASNSTSRKYDNELVLAVKQFQHRHGLKPDGIIGATTLKALNVSPKQRLQQLYQAEHDWQELAQDKDANSYLHVNVASYLLKIFEGEQTPLQMKVVVGTPQWPTPLLKSKLKTVVVNPRWNIPRNITEREIVHKVVKNEDYLEQEKITILDGWHKGAKRIDPSEIDWQHYAGDADLPYRLMQGAGEDNALGQVKFTFPNKEHVYLHDTPNKNVFELEKRNLSHGCVRLQHPLKLLDYLFNAHYLKYKDRINNHLQHTKRTMHYALKTKLPIYISKINVWVDDLGLLNFR